MTGVTVNIADGTADLVGGLLGYSGTSGIAEPTQITDCTVTGATITTSNESTRVGGLLGGGFYFDAYAAYYPVPARISVSSCTASVGSYDLVGYATELDTIEGIPGSERIFADGTGEEGRPYEIGDAAGLYAVRYDLDAHYKLTGDIDLGAAFDLNYGSAIYHMW